MDIVISSLHAYCENLNILHCNRVEKVAVDRSNSNTIFVNSIALRFSLEGKYEKKSVMIIVMIMIMNML